ncbi:DUF4369 domain-containing protein [uncultured Bacteroides sp.]|uniref:DUF4369 domain-containing protein n=1 Tax=uncultured Bacteroides sp. TaxID=162156 RepID=UPI00260DFA14|nr:DUF4369 domain-containing protein [uncultured Bacteroides sp.]
MVRMSICRVLPLLVFSLLLVSCSKKYKIEGNSSVTSLDGKMLYLKSFQGEDWVTVDSAEVVHGLFSMKGAADTVRMVTLYMDNDGIMPLVLENGTVKITISNTELLAEGTPLNDALYEFIEKRNAMELQLGELERKEARMVLDGIKLEDVQGELAQEKEKLMSEMNAYVKDFIIANYENVLGPSVFMMMCSTLPYPIMTSQIEDIIRTAPSVFKEDAFVKDFLSKAKENMKLIEEQKRLQENTQMTAQQK